MENIYKSLMRAAVTNNVDEVRAIVKSGRLKVGSTGQWKSKSGEDTALHAAVRHGSFEVIKFALEYCEVPVDFRNHDRKTLLHEAAQFSREKIASFLVLKGADVNALKKADWTPLMLACTKSELSIVTILLEAGADPSLRNKDGWNSFLLACRVGCLNIVELLASYGNSNNLPRDSIVTCRSNNGRTALHIAALNGHRMVVEYILRNKFIDVNVQDNCGTSPLMDACCNGSIEIVKYLAEKHGADVIMSDKNSLTSAKLAQQLGYAQIVSFLAEISLKSN